MLDRVFFSPPLEVRALSRFTLSASIVGANWLWVEKCFEQNGFYPYPLLRNAGFEGRLGLFSGTAVLIFVYTWGLRSLYMTVNGKAALVDER